MYKRQALYRLKSKERFVRECGLLDLMLIGTDEAVREIKKLLDDPDPYIAQHAQEVLDFLPTWRKFLKWQEELTGGEK